MTELEQFIQKLEELERTMTRGQWKVDEYDGFMLVYADFDPESPRRDYGVIHCATCAPAPLDNGNAHGIAHLKNSNPTVIAMLKAAIEGLKELRTHHLAGMSDPVWGAPYHKYRLRAIDQIVAHLNTLAASALGTKGASDE